MFSCEICERTPILNKIWERLLLLIVKSKIRNIDSSGKGKKVYLLISYCFLFVIFGGSNKLLKFLQNLITAIELNSNFVCFLVD